MICGKELLEIFDRLDGHGTNIKIQFFTQVIQQDPIVKAILTYATHPFKMYKIKSIQAQFPSDIEHCDWNSLFRALDQLAQARGADDRDKRIMAYIAGNCEHCRELVSMILNHKLRIGMGSKNLNKCGLEIPVPSVQLCEDDPSKFTSKRNFYYSPKMNGIRTTFERHGDSITFLSRKGHLFPKMHELFPDLDIPEGVLLDAEFMSARGRDHALGVSRTIHEFKDPIEDLRKITSLHIIDSPAEQDLFARLAFIEKLELPSRNSHLYVIPHTLIENAQEDQFEKTFIQVIDDMTNQGYEGVVFKNPYLSYYPDRSNDWVKGKRFYSVDLPVVGIKIGTEGKTSGLVSKLICNFKGVEVGVGSGLNDSERLEFLTNTPKMIEVRHQSITPAGSLEFPIFVRTRDDLV